LIEAERLPQCCCLFLDKLHTTSSSAIQVCTLEMLQGMCKMTHVSQIHEGIVNASSDYMTTYC